MELLLNLTWLLLVLPGYWLWRRGVQSRLATSQQCLLALGCVFVLLFPVISATDDLHAMRAEMEESSPGKRAVRPAGERHSAWVSLQGPAGLAMKMFFLPTPEVSPLQASTPSLRELTGRHFGHIGRAPPLSFLG